MNDTELKENRIVCLKQLRLSKWQLMWNREFELVILVNIDKVAIERHKKEQEKAKIKGEIVRDIDPETLKKVEADVNMKIQLKSSEIEKTKMEISVLDDIIKELETPKENA